MKSFKNISSNELKVGDKFVYKELDENTIVLAEAIHRYPHGMLCQLYRAKRTNGDDEFEVEKTLFKAFL